LVGGEGTRLRPLTYDTPKPMVPLFGVPFLERTLVRLRKAGVTDVILASGYLPSAIANHFGDGSRLGMQLTYVVEDHPLGTAGALRNVAGHIHGTFFVLNGDVLTSLDLRGMIAFHEATGGAGVLHAIRVDDPSAFGCIVRDAESRITAFIEKPARDDAPTDEVNAGTYLLERRVLDAIPAGRAVSIERETFPQLLAAGERLYSYVTDDYWLDVGRPQQYLQAHDDVLDGKLVLAIAGEALPERGTYWQLGASGLPANVKPPAYLGRDVSIDATATVGPYAVLGDRCRVGARATISDSIIWDDVEIGDGVRITDAILASKVRVGSGAVVTSGAVVGHDARIAPDAILEPDARIVARVNATTEHASKV
jgi:mannose-1-phosphate guanylyltransferase